MGFVGEGSCSSGGDKGGCFIGGMKSLVRRKQVDSANSKSSSASGSSHQLAKALTIPHLITIGVGSTIGAGVYILVGTVAREHSGPALTISFLIAGIAAALSAFCYAELASRCPSAGSAYHYSYICVGEGVAWLIGWALVLEYTIGGSAVARGISPNLGSDNITNDEGIPQLLNWWRARGTQFPKLSRMVKDVLAIQGSSVASEAAFSAARFQIGDHRYSLAEDSLEISVLFRDWINAERRNQGLPKLDSQFELFIDSAIGCGSDDGMELQDRQRALPRPVVDYGQSIAELEKGFTGLYNY